MGLVNQFIAQNVDHLAKIMTRGAAGRPMLRNDRGCLLGYNILAGMFELAPARMEAALEVLERAGESADTSLFPSLLAYTSSFALGENIGSLDPARLERTRALAAEVLQANPFNSISLACIGHVYGYVLGEHDIAAELFGRAVKLNPLQAFVWDHVALHKIYIGDLAGARAASDRAVSLGSYSPINYAYETTSCMVSALVGDHRRAVQLGERALVKQPRFHAAMRYALASLGHLGERERAERVRAKLLEVDPDFADPEVQRARFRLPVPEANARILEGIARAGI
jgi:tetratricopeptide (TPR) repeat protein